MPERLPMDLMVEILLHLPPPALNRLRWVSKNIKAITSEPHFIQRYYALHPYPPPTVGVFINRNYRSNLEAAFFPLANGFHPFSLPQPPISLDPDAGPPMLISSCNGLILVAWGYSNLYVCNPTNGAIHVLPDQPPLNMLCASYCLAFDLNNSISNGGAEGCLSPHEFTVVSIDHGDRPTVFRTYSSATREWRKSAATFISDDGDNVMTHYRESEYLNGSMYWIPRDGQRILYVLHIAEERFTSIPLPRIPQDQNRRILNLSVSGGCLHVTFAFSGYSGQNFDIWEMNADSSSWTLVCTFKPMDHISLDVDKHIMYAALLRREGEREDKIIAYYYCGPLLLYNLAYHTLQETITLDDTLANYVHVSRYLPLITF